MNDGVVSKTRATEISLTSSQLAQKSSGYHLKYDSQSSESLNTRIGFSNCRQQKLFARVVRSFSERLTPWEVDLPCFEGLVRQSSPFEKFKVKWLVTRSISIVSRWFLSLLWRFPRACDVTKEEDRALHVERGCYTTVYANSWKVVRHVQSGPVTVTIRSISVVFGGMKKLCERKLSGTVVALRD